MTNFEDNFEKAQRQILISGDPKILVEFPLKLPYQFSELRIANKDGL